MHDQQYQGIREFVFSFVQALPPELLDTTIPQYKNTLRWNIGHLVVTRQILTLKRMDLNGPIPHDIVEQYKKGTSQIDVRNKPTIAKWESWSQEITRLLENTSDIHSLPYEQYKTSTGVEIHSLEEAMRFLNFHDGIHFGYMLSMKRHIQ